MSDLTSTSIALIVLGVIVVVLFIILMIYFYTRKRARNLDRDVYPPIYDPNPTMEEYFVGKSAREQTENSKRQELERKRREQIKQDFSQRQHLRNQLEEEKLERIEEYVRNRPDLI
jgi:flagellar biosynthesis/type III secretory pathway M-ring protein FliF/YscJ